VKAPGKQQGRPRAAGQSTAPARDRTPAFLRVLKLEETRGHDDGAVFGGLDAFIKRWLVEEPGNDGLARLAEAGLLPVDYRGLDPKSRADWAARAVRVAGGQANVEPPLSKPPVGVQGLAPLQDRPAKAVASAPTPNPLPQRKAAASKETTAKDRGSSTSPDAPVAALRSAGRGRAVSLLGKLGVQTLRDLVYLFPRRHNPVRSVAELYRYVGEEQTTLATLVDVRPVHLGRMESTEGTIGDDGGTMRVVWYNQKRLAQWLKPGVKYVFSGKVGAFRGEPVLESPDHEEVRSEGVESLLQAGGLFPVYPSTEGLFQPPLRRMVREALARCADALPDALPVDVRERNGFPSLRQALWQAHYPETPEQYEAARRRLAFEELFLIQLGVLARRKELEAGAQSVPLMPPMGFLASFFGALPFTLTAAQERVLREVLSDLAKTQKPMSRLLQGEVGSGKTVVALAALLTAAACGYQGAIMAPTEVLAEQHFLTVGRLLEKLARPTSSEDYLAVYLEPYPKPITIGLLTGSTPARRKRAIQGLLEDGALDVLIGTHAIIQEDVRIPRLALAVVDEQHRFGVEQRAALRKQGLHPHLLLMSATPIPRTLALTLYGDLDLSTIDQLPPGRQKVRTRLVTSDRRQAVYDFIRKEVSAGRQAFVIYPLIDESEAVNARAAVVEEERLSRTVFPDLRVGLLHGRMPLREKREVMEAFRKGEVDVLVSTPVIEVGIDVPNATVMVVEGADRFGLAQLHQFRGRVGRGQHASYCVLVSAATSPESKERLGALERLDDGFQLAEVDLQMRGPGDYFGTRQSGLPDLRMARVTDTDLLALARQEATALLEADPGLAAPGYAALKAALGRFAAPVGGEVG